MNPQLLHHAAPGQLVSILWLQRAHCSLDIAHLRRLSGGCRSPTQSIVVSLLRRSMAPPGPAARESSHDFIDSNLGGWLSAEPMT